MQMSRHFRHTNLTIMTEYSANGKLNRMQNSNGAIDRLTGNKKCDFDNMVLMHIGHIMPTVDYPNRFIAQRK